LRTLTIAAEIGYSSSANFSTAFQQFYGVSPSVFRKFKGNVEEARQAVHA
ncbi:MAG: AraC family transcriptional regulator, partial [Alcaligenaceae bacterium]|nr:AraC family transcriptional regulator [Alcaligenaceae bacterium]